MNDIQSFLTEALPSLSSNKISEVCELLSTIGFKQVEDLSYVEPENDLKTCLNTLQCRILKKKCCSCLTYLPDKKVETLSTFK